MAGIEWMKRHRVLSLRKPEIISLSRSINFNNNFTPDRIYNLDEINIMTVVRARNVGARTGQKQAEQSVSVEIRGQLITMCAIIHALRNTIPPVFIFPYWSSSGKRGVRK